MTYTHLAILAVLLITLGAFFVYRSAIERARHYERGREEGIRELDYSRPPMRPMRVEERRSDQPIEGWGAPRPDPQRWPAPKVGAPEEMAPTMFAPARARYTGAAAHGSPTPVSITPPVLPQERFFFEEDEARPPPPEKNR